MHQVWIGAGWKMNHTLREAEAYAVALRQFIESSQPSMGVFVVPPYTVLHRVSSLLKETPIMVGAQNMHWEERGAHTGEISPLMLKDCGVDLVELGHCERRLHFGETDKAVNLKTLAALRHGLRPLICVGETVEEGEYGVAYPVLARQVRIALRGVPSQQVRHVMFAYEPAWAIGDGGTPADPDSVRGAVAWLRSQVAEAYTEQAAGEIAILYGGSVSQENAYLYLSQPGVDGLFIGRAAWKAEDFIAIIHSIEVRAAKTRLGKGVADHEDSDRK